MVELNCPICDADFALGGDEKPGDAVYCSFCGSPCRGSPQIPTTKSARSKTISEALRSLFSCGHSYDRIRLNLKSVFFGRGHRYGS